MDPELQVKRKLFRSWKFAVRNAQEINLVLVRQHRLHLERMAILESESAQTFGFCPGERTLTDDWIFLARYYANRKDIESEESIALLGSEARQRLWRLIGMAHGTEGWSLAVQSTNRFAQSNACR